MYSVAKKLKDLPAIFTLDMTLKSLLVDSLAEADHEEAFRLIQESAERGDNVGFDEFPSLKDFQDMTIFSAAFSVRDVTSDSLLSIIIVQPSAYSRSVSPYLSTLHLITSSEISQRLYWRDLARLAERLLLQLGLRYGACLTSVFYPCVERIMAMKDEGFRIIACINESGKLAGSKNFIASYIFHKDFGLTSIPKFSPSEVRHYVDSVLNCLGHASDHLVIPFLPVEYVLQDGTAAILRSMRNDEASLFDEMYDRGFGLDEWPTKSYFERAILSRSYNMVLEEKLSGKEIAAFHLCDSLYSRGASARLLDGYAAMHPDFVGQGLARELVDIVEEMGSKLGFRAVQTDTTADNMASMAILFSKGYAMTGVIPNSIYVTDRGWIDAVLFFKTLPNAAPESRSFFQKNGQMSKL